MQQARFSEQLHMRREQLRLTIPQAAKVLRMRESVLVAFEQGDFKHLPPLGYAQGMVSSYARYLGLDAREITAQYEAEHAAYVASITGSRPTGLASLSDEPGLHNPLSGAVSSQRGNVGIPGPSAEQGAYGASYGESGRVSEPIPRAGRGKAGAYGVGSSAGTPVGAGATGAGMGSASTGYSAASSVMRPLSSAQTSAMRPTNLPRRYDNSYGQNVMADAERTAVTHRSSEAERYSDQFRYNSRSSSSEGEQGRSRRYTTRAPEQPTERTRSYQANRVRKARSAEESSNEYIERGQSRYSSMQERYERTGSPYASSYHQDTIRTREVSGSYQDDLRYDAELSPFRASSTREGREGIRNMPAPERPNVRRRSGSSSERSRRREQPQAQGFSGYLQAFLADPQRAVLSIGVITALLLLIILVLSVKSCVAANSTDSRQVNVVTSLAASTTAEASGASETEQQVLSEAAAKAAASADAAQYTETKVKVSIADGATTWIEITCDGEQKVAESITGAWEQEYTVTQSITIQVVDPSSVTVEKNGAVQSFSSKSAGLSSLTIEGTDPAAAAAATAATTQASDDSEDGNYDSSDDERDYYSDDSGDGSDYSGE